MYKYLYRRILSYPSLCPMRIIPNEDVYSVYKKTIIDAQVVHYSMLYHPIGAETFCACVIDETCDFFSVQINRIL